MKHNKEKNGYYYSKEHQKFKVQIQHKGIRVFIGLFAYEADAKEAYKHAKQILVHGGYKDD